MADTAPAPSKPAQNTRPPLYQQPVAFDSKKHADWRLAQSRDFNFAAKIGSLPLTAVEFLSAARSFPIVFGLDAPHTPLAFVGLTEPDNLFVDENGQWEPLTYIPAYVRRYPFLFLNDTSRPDNNMILGVDAKYQHIGPKQDGEALVTSEGKATEALQGAMDFCGDFNRQWDISLALSAALKEHGLLVEEESKLTFPDKREVTIRGFLTIDEKKLNELPAETFVEWRDRGWLAPIYGVIASKLNWNLLVQRYVSRKMAQAKS